MILSSTVSFIGFVMTTALPFIPQSSIANQHSVETELQRVRRNHANREYAQQLAMIENPDVFVFHKAKRKPKKGNTYENVIHEAYTGLKRIEINLSHQKMNLIETGSIIASYPISSGKYQTPTPIGSFEVHRKQDLRISSQAVPYRMPNYLAFTPNEAYGIHALPYLGYSAETSGYWHEALDHIGTPVSHGCVRLLPEDSEVVFDWAEVGVPISIQG